MRRFVSVLLIPLCLFGALMPHSHHGTSEVNPNSHATQPHLHFAVGHIHGHSHFVFRGHQHSTVLDHHHAEKGGSAGGNRDVAPLSDHDADALYLTDQTSDGRRQVVEPTNTFAMQADDERLGRREANRKWAWPPPDAEGGLPIYLRISSLRI